MATGFDAVSLADVAARVGLARTAMYNYFPDRESLLFAWTDREVQRTLSELQSQLENAGASAEKLQIFVRSQLVEFKARHLPPGKEVFQFLRPETYEQFMHHIEPLDSVLLSIISEGVEGGEFAPADLAATVTMVMACIGTERVPLATGSGSVDEATKRVTKFVLRALSSETHVSPKKKKGS